MEYTKGEWKVDERVGCIAVYTQEQYDKANCSPCIGEADKYAIHFKHRHQGKDGWEISPEDIANAHLIAQAPKLYEALKVAHRELLHAQWEDGLDQIEEALAKVEGK